jgi:hypothetical protein
MNRAPYSIYCDQAEIARIGNGRYLVALIPPGKHSSDRIGKRTVDIDAQPGSLHYIELVFSLMWDGKGWFRTSRR